MEAEDVFGAHTSKVAQIVERNMLIEFAHSEAKLSEWLKQKPNNKELLKVYLDYSELLRIFAVYFKHNGILKNELEKSFRDVRTLNFKLRQVEKERNELLNKLGELL